MRTLAILVLLTPAALAAQIARDSIITVNASRSIRVAPDRAVLFIAVEATAETAAGALTLSESKVAAVLAALRALGPSVDVGAPTTFSVSPTSAARGFTGAPGPVTITARTAIRVQLMRIGELSRVLATAGGAGAVGGSAISYTMSAADSVRRVAARNALASARADAEELARGLGGRVGGVVDLSTTSDDRMYQQPSMLSFDAAFPQQSVAPEVVLHVTLLVRFHLVK